MELLVFAIGIDFLFLFKGLYGLRNFQVMNVILYVLMEAIEVQIKINRISCM